MEVCTVRYAWTALCITAFVMSGGGQDPPTATTTESHFGEGGSVKLETTTNASVTYTFTFDIINRIYNVSLLKPGSPDYEILSAEVKGALYSIYGCATCNTRLFYQRVSAMTFSNRTGAVLVKAAVLFQSDQVHADELKYIFMIAVSGGDEINRLKIDPKFTQVSPPSTPAPTVSHTSRPTMTPNETVTDYTTKHPTTAHPNAASSFNQSPMTLTSFLRYSVSFCLLFLISYSF